jgi:nicotinamidase-related amidase
MTSDINELRSAQLAQLTAPGRRPALLVVDVQRDFAEPERLSALHLTDAVLADLATAVRTIAGLVDTARGLGVPVVWVELGSDPARPWRASNWLRGGDYDAPMGPDEPCVLGASGAAWYGMEPAEGEIRVVKRGYSGFLGTDLDTRLREELDCAWLTVVGLTTECCVQATAQDALQLDWPVLVARDATAAYDPGVHEAALAQLALNIAVLCESDEVAALWKQASP